jgi:hypothetical protein
MGSSVLVGTAVKSATSTINNAVKYALTETPLIPTITGGDVRCECIHGEPVVKPKRQKRNRNRKRNRKSPSVP